MWLCSVARFHASLLWIFAQGIFHALPSSTRLAAPLTAGGHITPNDVFPPRVWPSLSGVLKGDLAPLSSYSNLKAIDSRLLMWSSASFAYQPGVMCIVHGFAVPLSSREEAVQNLPLILNLNQSSTNSAQSQTHPLVIPKSCFSSSVSRTYLKILWLPGRRVQPFASVQSTFQKWWG